MLVVAHAHQEEVRAARARDRALHRLNTLAASYHAPIVMPPRMDRRRVARALASYRNALRTLFAAQRRHSMWYRAYLHARRKAPKQ